MNNIGFGCARLTSNLTEKYAIKILNVAYDCGIRHFDVARLYGYGLAEGILGKFARGKRNDITITTKVGLLPNNVFLKNLLFQNGIRHLYRLMKKSGTSRVLQHRVEQTFIKTLKIDDVRRSLETSLKELKTDYIDYFLLHEAEIVEANSKELIDFLETQKNKGSIKAYGIGSYAEILVNDFPLLNKSYTVLQTNNSFPDSVPEILLNAEHLEKRFYFSPMHHLATVKGLFEADLEIVKRISDLLNYSVQDSFIDLFLIQQLYCDPTGTFLFSSNKIKNIIATTQRWSYLQAFSSDTFNHFAEIRSIVNERLFQKLNNTDFIYAKND